MYHFTMFHKIVQKVFPYSPTYLHMSTINVADMFDHLFREQSITE